MEGKGSIEAGSVVGFVPKNDAVMEWTIQYELNRELETVEREVLHQRVLAAQAAGYILEEAPRAAGAAATSDTALALKA